jgi:hypothetical protein
MLGGPGRQLPPRWPRSLSSCDCPPPDSCQAWGEQSELSRAGVLLECFWHSGFAVLIVCGDGSDLGQTHEDHGWELWFPLNEMFQAGDYEGVCEGPRIDRDEPAIWDAALQPRLRREPRRTSVRCDPAPGAAIERWDGARDLARGTTTSTRSATSPLPENSFA